MDSKTAKSEQESTSMEPACTKPTDRDEPSLEQRLWNISHATEDGRVRGHIDTCKFSDNGTILIRVRLPNAETHTQTFPMPKTDSSEYAFVRLVEECGYSLASAGQLVGNDDTDGARVWCEPIDVSERATELEADDDQADTDQNRTDDWRLVVPEYTPPFRERLRARLGTLNSSDIITPLTVAGGLLLLPLIFPIILFRVAGNDSEEVFDVIIFGGLALVLWLAVMMLVYTAVLATVV